MNDDLILKGSAVAITGGLLIMPIACGYLLYRTLFSSSTPKNSSSNLAVPKTEESQAESVNTATNQIELGSGDTSVLSYSEGVTLSSPSVESAYLEFLFGELYAHGNVLIKGICMVALYSIYFKDYFVWNGGSKSRKPLIDRFKVSLKDERYEHLSKGEELEMAAPVLQGDTPVIIPDPSQGLQRVRTTLHDILEDVVPDGGHVIVPVSLHSDSSGGTTCTMLSSDSFNLDEAPVPVGHEIKKTGQYKNRVWYQPSTDDRKGLSLLLLDVVDSNGLKKEPVSQRRRHTLAEIC